MSRVRWRACKPRRRRRRRRGGRCRRGTRVRPGGPRWRSCKRRRLAATVGSTTCWALTCAAAASLYSPFSFALSLPPSLHFLLYHSLDSFLSLSPSLLAALFSAHFNQCRECPPLFVSAFSFPIRPCAAFIPGIPLRWEIRNLLHEPGFSYLCRWGLVDFCDR